MPAKKRFKTQYPGVYFINGISPTRGTTEKIYYILYRKNRKLIEEKAGRQYQDNMTAAKAARIRTQRIEGKQLSNKEIRLSEQEEKLRRRWTINRLWEEYKSGRELTKSLKSDDYIFQKHISPLFGSITSEEIEPREIDRFRKRLLQTKSAQTVRYLLLLLRRLINFGINRNYCTGLTFKLEFPRVNNQNFEDLTPGQLQNLLDAIEQEPNVQAANIMRMALFTGMRRGELFRLQWDDLDFDRGFILLRNPKGGVDQKIPLNMSAREVLQQHPRSDSPYVFPGRGGNQRTDIKKQVNRIKERAGLPKDFRALHGLRHVYASILASSGKVDMYTLQKLLTHKSPQMTQRYAHLRDEALKKASELVGDLIKVNKE